MKLFERQKRIIRLSLVLIGIAIFLMLSKELNLNNNEFTLAYEYVNIKDMATVEVAQKKGTTNNNQYTAIENNNTQENIKQEKIEESALQMMNNSLALKNKVNWYLPVEIGYITTMPQYSHVALDITSYRGVYETIFPVASGTITGIYTDNAGGKVVTVHHVVDGVNYTSMYVHFSSYADNIYVGKEVTINDPLGQMGATGIATGVHLHISVMDCTLFDPNDPNCSDLNGYFRYAKYKYSQGFTGLNSLMEVPGSWYSR